MGAYIAISKDNCERLYKHAMTSNVILQTGAMTLKPGHAYLFYKFEFNKESLSIKKTYKMFVMNETYCLRQTTLRFQADLNF